MLNILTIRRPRVSRAFFFLDWKTRYKIHETKGWVFFKIKKNRQLFWRKLKLYYPKPTTIWTCNMSILIINMTRYSLYNAKRREDNAKKTRCQIKWVNKYILSYTILKIYFFFFLSFFSFLRQKVNKTNAKWIKTKKRRPHRREARHLGCETPPHKEYQEPTPTKDRTHHANNHPHPIGQGQPPNHQDCPQRKA